MVLYASNLGTQETEAEGLGTQGQPGLRNKTLSQKKRKQQKDEGRPDVSNTEAASTFFDFLLLDSDCCMGYRSGMGKTHMVSPGQLHCDTMGTNLGHGWTLSELSIYPWNSLEKVKKFFILCFSSKVTQVVLSIENCGLSHLCILKVMWVFEYSVYSFYSCYNLTKLTFLAFFCLKAEEGVVG